MGHFLMKMTWLDSPMIPPPLTMTIHWLLVPPHSNHLNPETKMTMPSIAIRLDPETVLQAASPTLLQHFFD
jgi:hypothetical protein